MAILEIPLNPYPELFQIEINGTPFYLRTHWNVAMQRWTIDVGLGENDWLIRNLALVSGVDLLEQYEHLGLGFELRLWVDGNIEGEATFENLGNEARLLVVT